jgi:FkbM family methyltransferase
MLERIVRRLIYIRKSTRELRRFLPENGVGTVLMILAAEARVQRKDFTAKVRGMPLYFRSFSSDMLIINDWLRDDIAKQYRLAKDIDGVIVDAGGHIGCAAIAFAHAFPEKTVVTLEPSAENFRLLEKNTRAFANIIPLNCALGPANEMARISDRTGNTDGYVIAPRHGADLPEDETSIPVRTIESILAEVGAERISILKLDIEGFEYELLKDRPAWIRNVGLVAIELHERFRPGSTRAYIHATDNGRTDLGLVGEMYFSLSNDVAK